MTSVHLRQPRHALASQLPEHAAQPNCGQHACVLCSPWLGPCSVRKRCSIRLRCQEAVRSTVRSSATPDRLLLALLSVPTRVSGDYKLYATP